MILSDDYSLPFLHYGCMICVIKNAWSSESSYVFNSGLGSNSCLSGCAAFRWASYLLILDLARRRCHKDSLHMRPPPLLCLRPGSQGQSSRWGPPQPLPCLRPGCMRLVPLPGEAAPGFVGCAGGSGTDYNQVSACGFLCLRPPSSPNWIFSTKKSPFWVMFTWQGFGWSSWLITNERESYFLPSLCIIYSVIFQSVSRLIHHKSLCRLQKR